MNLGTIAGRLTFECENATHWLADHHLMPKRLQRWICDRYEWSVSQGSSPDSAKPVSRLRPEDIAAMGAALARAVDKQKVILEADALRTANQQIGDQSMRKNCDRRPVISGKTFTGGGTPGFRVNADRTRRPLAWLYGPGGWTGRLVALGSDAATPTHYRLTVVFRLLGQRAVVFALWKRPYDDGR